MDTCIPSFPPSLQRMATDGDTWITDVLTGSCPHRHIAGLWPLEKLARGVFVFESFPSLAPGRPRIHLRAPVPSTRRRFRGSTLVIAEDCCIPGRLLSDASACLHGRGGDRCLSFPLQVTLCQLGIRRADGSPKPRIKTAPSALPAATIPWCSGKRSEERHPLLPRPSPPAPSEMRPMLPSWDLLRPCSPSTPPNSPLPTYTSWGTFSSASGNFMHPNHLGILLKCKAALGLRLSGLELGTKLKGVTKHSVIEIKIF